jgi:hypothetical protein
MLGERLDKPLLFARLKQSAVDLGIAAAGPQRQIAFLPREGHQLET